MIKFTSDRLLLRAFTKDDAPFIRLLMNSKGWIEFIGDRSIHSNADAEAYIIKNYLGSYQKHGFGAYLVLLKETNTPIGSCGLYKRDNLDYPDIGFAFLPEYHARGYAFESASRIMEFAKEDLDLKTILGITMEENRNSVRLLNKLGMKNIDTIKLNEDPVPLLLFSKSF